ncbi:homeobox protein CDX-1a [Centroberyx gerrardi]
MYSNSHPARHPAQTLSLNNQYIPPPYGDFTGYHHVPGVGDLLHNNPSTGAWTPAYAAAREEYSPYGHGFPGSSPNSVQVSFTSPDLTGMPTAAGGASFTAYSFPPGQDSPNSSRRKSYEWVRQSGHPAVSGKTRTKDKYRVVYTDHQRLELEKEFQFSRYITIRRKTELSQGLSLSERQVKIWFQNRRAKERKLNRKKLQLSQQASTTTPTPPVPGGPTDAPMATSPSSNILSDTISEEY